MTAPATNLNTCYKNNAAQMDLFLKMIRFNIPTTIPRDAANSPFPLCLLTKTLPNGEACARDWLCWSKEKQSMYCDPCFIANKSNANQSSFSPQSGWNIVRGWRKLNDKKPPHENSNLYKEN